MADGVVPLVVAALPGRLEVLERVANSAGRSEEVAPFHDTSSTGLSDAAMPSVSADVADCIVRRCGSGVGLASVRGRRTHWPLKRLSSVSEMLRRSTESPGIPAVAPGVDRESPTACGTSISTTSFIWLMRPWYSNISCRTSRDPMPQPLRLLVAIGESGFGLLELGPFFVTGRPLVVDRIHQAAMERGAGFGHARHRPRGPALAKTAADRARANRARGAFPRRSSTAPVPTRRGTRPGPLARLRSPPGNGRWPPWEKVRSGSRV